jgi:SAM-dependent methyltransferase
VKPSAIRYFVCISCGADLKLETAIETEIEGEIDTGTLQCTKCSCKYPIVRGVPRFVDQNQSGVQDINTGDKFAHAWKEFARWDDRYKRQFFDWVEPVDEKYVFEKVVLEAGCGKGRHVKIMSECGASEVFAIDIGEAVDIAYQAVGKMRGVHIIQADIKNLPFKPKSFDFVFSVGVLHHMENPAAGFSQLTRFVKDTGSICTWVYGRENNWWLVYLVNPIRVAITSHLSLIILKPLAAILAFLVYVWAKFQANIWCPAQKKLPFMPNLFYQDYMIYIARFDFSEIHHITFDHLIAPVSHYVQKDEVVSWFRNANMADPIIRWHNKNSWSAFWSNQKKEMEQIRQNYSGLRQ